MPCLIEHRGLKGEYRAQLVPMAKETEHKETNAPNSELNSEKQTKKLQYRRKERRYVP